MRRLLLPVNILKTYPMKNILIGVAAAAIMVITSCSVGAGIQIRASENSSPKESSKSTVQSNRSQKDSLQSKESTEPVK